MSNTPTIADAKEARLADLRDRRMAAAEAADLADRLRDELRMSIVDTLNDGTLSATELADFLGVSRQRVYRMRQEVTPTD